MIVLTLALSLLITTPTTYGTAPKAETPMITIEAFRQNPAAFLDKVVRVEGEVKEVCPMKGCWLDLSDGSNQVRIQVKDGEIVFEKNLIGQTIVAEGTVYKFELSKEQAVKYYAHLAEEKNESFDPATVKSGTTIYQIGGIGVQTKP